ncbi:MAG TPA: quinone-dependent dihydroorotate dehydrogenase [Allosphingosinicella sp.]|nr:quinone-dependent dihydroorotate dehydrogenase [Allosphingosinicella sp.]
MALYPLLRPLVFALDAERAHRLTIRALKALPAGAPPGRDPALAISVAGLDFLNPLGLAAGFDKDAEVVCQMLGFGFGFVEVGTLTPLPQPGNPKPRLFRLAEDRAVINRMGFNNGGFEAAKLRLRTPARRWAGRWSRDLDKLQNRGPGLVGVNIGANKDSVDRIADYVAGAREMVRCAAYLTVNVSSPNTPGLRELQDESLLRDLLAAVVAERDDFMRGLFPRPVFLKVAPDLGPAEIDGIVRAAIEGGADGLIVGNTTLSRPPLRSSLRDEAGGLSGAPLKDLALQRLKDFRAATGGALALIAAGGIENGVDAYARIRAGASLVQLYTALVYQGPGIAASILGELRTLLRRDGFATLAEAVG